MGYRELSRMEIVEVVRRWQLGESQRAIARASGVARETVKKYLRAAEELGLGAHGPPPTEDQVVRLVQVGRVVSAPRTWASPQADRLEPYREQITTWLQEEHLQVTRVQELLGQRGVHVPYTTLERFVWRLGFKPRGRRGDTVRMAPTPPGEVAEMDFERLGLLLNPETGRRQWIWGLSITLTYSRHSFLWPLVHQTVEATIDGLEKAWAFFQGCPSGWCSITFRPRSPAPTRSTRARRARSWSTARRAGFCWTLPACGGQRISPRSSDLSNTHAVASGRAAPSSTSPTHGARPTVVPGGRRSARAWHHPQAAAGGLRRRRTRAPAAVRRHPVRRAALERRHGPPRSPRQRPVRAVLGAVDDVPPGTKLEVRCDRDLVKLYKAGALVKVHPRKPKGGRSTDADDYPPERTAYAMRAPDRLVRQAAAWSADRSVRRALAGCTLPVVQAAPGPAAAAVSRALHARAPGGRVCPSARLRPGRRAPSRAHSGAGPGTRRSAGTARRAARAALPLVASPDLVPPSTIASLQPPVEVQP